MDGDEQSISTCIYHAKAAYSFSLVWFIFHICAVLISFFLPWDYSMRNFFELWYGAVFVLLFLFAIPISVILLSFRDVMNPYGHRYLLLAWFFWWYSILAYNFPQVFSRVGLGRNLMGYLLVKEYEFILFPNYLYMMGKIFLIVMIFFTLVLLFCKGLASLIRKILGGKINLERWHWKPTLRKLLNLLMGIGCFLLTAGTVGCIIVAIFLPWTSSNNFFAFLVLNGNENIMGFVIAFICVLGFLSFSVLWILRNRSSFHEGPMGAGGRNFLWWFIFWHGTWVTLSISKAFLLIFLGAGSIVAGEGLLLFLYTAQFVVLLSIILSMGVVLAYIIRDI
ncbi:MAG: hypothetical protein ACTSRS_07725 [Candidatus Helarchaeota archaeon]